MAVIDESERASTGPGVATVDMARPQCAGPGIPKELQYQGVEGVEGRVLGGMGGVKRQ